MIYLYFEQFVEVIFALSLFINSLLFIPQAIGIYKAKTARGQSLTTFLGFNIIQILTIIHAYIHRDYILFWGFVLALLSCGAVTALIIKYREY